MCSGKASLNPAVALSQVPSLLRTRAHESRPIKSKARPASIQFENPGALGDSILLAGRKSEVWGLLARAESGNATSNPDQ